MSDQLVLVVSPASAKGAAFERHQRVADAFKGAGWEVDIHVTRSLSHATELTAGLQKGELVAALGGDGLIAAVAAGAVRSGAALVPLPGGRGNDFCRYLGIPADPVVAARAVPSWANRQIDVGKVGDRVFLGVASVGIDSLTNEYANRAAWARQFGYAVGLGRALLGYRWETFDLVVDGRQEEVRGWSVAVGNTGRYGGGMRMCPEAEVDDGYLDLVTIGPVRRSRLLLSLPRLYNGTHITVPGVVSRRVKEVRIAMPTASRAFTVFADGDPVGSVPVDITVESAALTVRCRPVEPAPPTS